MYDHKVEIDELQQLEHKQESDVASVLESEEIGSDESIDPMLHALDAGVDAPAADATPAWAENFELANHFADSDAEALVKHVHDLMADDVAALVHEHVAEAEDDEFEYEGLIPDFFADTAQTQDEAEKGKLDDTMLVSSSSRKFLEEDDPWNGGGGGGGGGTGGPNDPPPEDAGDADAPPEDPKAKKVAADAKPKPDPKPAPKPAETKPTPRRDDKGGGGKS